ncbi:MULTISPECIES: hypothetical protein [Acinetobacter]|uniref:Uncharacterized protein n=1 Tax=Acinetobacter tianfuensis TaxID=2419603 RepID=A0A3A8E2L5_9GAMM|nr:MULTISPECIES: hypothetical protein [Acinetobacter]RKG29207.1 hypothetical protein D7V32_16045 [Acinetobacter tianfuensis]
MSEQQNNLVEDAKAVSDLIAKIGSGELSDAELKDAKKALKLIQQRAEKAIKELDNRLPSLTSKELSIIKNQKFLLGEIVISQVFTETKIAESALTESEREQFLALTLKLVQAQSKQNQKKIFLDTDTLSGGLYLHSEDERRKKLNRDA